MYTRIIDPSITIYNGETNDFIGEAGFQFSPQSEMEMLRLVNYNKVPSSLVLMNLNFYQQSTYFDPPTINEPSKRKGIMKAIFINTAGEQIPMEIRLRYDAMARGNLLGSSSFFESVEYGNIVVDLIEEVSY